MAPSPVAPYIDGESLAVGSIGLDLVAVVAWFVAGQVFMSVNVHLNLEIEMAAHVEVLCMGMQAALWRPGWSR
jgi:hypothetical protein